MPLIMMSKPSFIDSVIAAVPGAAPAYRRVLLKISGEALAGGQGYGIDPDVIGQSRRFQKALAALPVRARV